MAKYRFDKNLTSKVLNTLIFLAEHYRGRRFRINDYTIIPKAVIICEGEICYLLEAFSRSLENVKAAVFDVAGLHKRYATQIEIYNNGNVIVSPKRPREAVEDFLNKIADYMDK